MTGGVPDLIARRAALAPERIALEDALTGRTVTYAELEERSSRAATLLRARAIREGDRIAILCRNRIEFFELLFACAKLGAVLVPLNWRMPAAELDALVADADPALLIYGAEDGQAASALATRAPAIALDSEYEALLWGTDLERFRTLWPSAATWYLLYTSGTTGRPKGVIYTFAMALANYASLRTAIDLVSSDSTLTFLPNFHTAGINLHALPTLFAGGRVLLLPGFDADAVIDLIEARRVNAFFAVPTVYQALLEHSRFAAAPLGQVRHWGCGGAPLPDSIALACRDTGIRLCNGMGMTETGPTAFLLDQADA
ncbi:MAG TPA: AMP-binding protein, partial [Allosphingosinicella sp.]